MAQPALPQKAIDWALKKDIPGLIERFMLEGRVDPSADRSLLFRRACRQNAVKIVELLLEWDAVNYSKESKYRLDLFARSAEAFIVACKTSPRALLCLLVEATQKRSESHSLELILDKMFDSAVRHLNAENLQFLMDLFPEWNLDTYGQLLYVSSLNPKFVARIDNKPFCDTLFVLLNALSQTVTEQPDVDPAEILKALYFAYDGSDRQKCKVFQHLIERFVPVKHMNLDGSTCGIVRKLFTSMISAGDVDNVALLLGRGVFVHLKQPIILELFCKQTTDNNTVSMLRTLLDRCEFDDNHIWDSLQQVVSQPAVNVEIFSLLFSKAKKSRYCFYDSLCTQASLKATEIMFAGTADTPSLVAVSEFPAILHSLIIHFTSEYVIKKVLGSMLYNPDFQISLFPKSDLEQLEKRGIFRLGSKSSANP